MKHAAFAEFVGFVAAHAMWQLESGKSLAPIVAYKSRGENKMEKFPADDYQKAVKEVTEYYWSDVSVTYDSSLFIVDTTISYEGKEFPALVVQAELMGEVSVNFAIPYRPATGKKPLAIFGPRIGENNLENVEDFFEAVNKGVESHESAHKFIMSHYDSTV